jgi:hypothetical protein
MRVLNLLPEMEYEQNAMVSSCTSNVPHFNAENAISETLERTPGVCFAFPNQTNLPPTVSIIELRSSPCLTIY